MKRVLLKLASVILISIILLINISQAIVTCTGLKSVSAGETHTLALSNDNYLYACGDNQYLQSGLGRGVSKALLLKHVKGENGEGYLNNIVTFDAGWYHSLAANSDGTIWSWGTDNAGQLGNGSGQQDSDVPQKVHGVDDIDYLIGIVNVSAGRSGTHSLAVDSDGYVYAWGNNGSGQCGDETYSQRNVPVQVLDDNPSTNGVYLGNIAHIIKVDAGVNHSLALDGEGHVWHWGSGSSTINYPEKVKASSSFGGQILSNIIGIATCYHSLAVDSSGFVWEWSSSNEAYKVPGGQMGTTYLQDIVEVVAGNYRSMARTSDGTVLLWSPGQYAYPVYVPDGMMDTTSGKLEGIISIGHGWNDFKLSVSSDGRGWGWGDNTYGQLGLGDTISRSEPSSMLCVGTSNSSGIIYVDKKAVNGANNGTSWDDAYLDLYDAVFEAEIYLENHSSCEIWVAGNSQSYKPRFVSGYEYSATFNIPRGNLAIRGHFGGKGVYETSPEQRNFDNPAYETTIDGYSTYGTVSDLITCDNTGEGLLLERFTITGASRAIYINNFSDPSISKCKFTGITGSSIEADNYSYPNISDSHFYQNGYSSYEIYSHISSWPYVKNCVLDGGNQRSYGIYANNAVISIENCVIENYLDMGLYFTNYSDMTVNGCKIGNNGNYGIYSDTSVEVKIENSWIYNNGSDSTDAGLYLSYTVSPQEVTNNTFYGNAPYGIYVYSGHEPVLKSDILWGNGTNIFNVRGLQYIIANYCCIENGLSGTGNISDYPDFADTGINDFHLLCNSPCINTGDPAFLDFSDKDIDVEDRIANGRVDIGADEVTETCDCLYVGRVFSATVGSPELTVTQVMVDKWVYLGKPSSWCCEAQKRGNGVYTGSSATRVDAMDLAAVKHADTWYKTYTQTGYNPNVDFDLSGKIDAIDLARVKNSANWYQVVGGCP